METKPGGTVSNFYVKRAFLPLLLIGMVGISNGQGSTLQDARDLLTPVLGDLAMRNSFAFLVAGEEEVRGRIVPFETHLAMQRGGTLEAPTLFIEMVSRRDGRLVERLVADGDHIWIYDAVAHTFGSMSYQRTAPGIRSAIDTLRRRSTHANLAILTLLGQVQRARLEGAALAANSWVPTSPLAELQVTESQLIMTSQSPAWSRTIFDLAVINGQKTLRSIQFESVTRIAGRDTLASWNATLRDTVPSWVSYTFNPGTAKPVSLGLSQRG